MTKAKRRAPDPEWVLMYRKGMSSPKIAAVTLAPESTVRYHLHLAVQAEPGLRDEHRKALGPVTRTTSAGRRNLEDTVAFYQRERRLPASGKDARERALASWLHMLRQQAAAGTLSPVYREGLAAVPGWDTVTSRSAENAARWERRMAELVAYLAAGNDWPRHKDFEAEHERVLGVWVHVQRISRRDGTLTAVREAQLNEFLPGWREGRGHRGDRRR
ncbi:UNVERIFIED_ORG: hypothetical protein ABIB21_003108 [Arthrobacter sp. UYEF13]